MSAKSPRITLYSTRGCTHCRQLKLWLKQHHLPFRDMDIQRNPRALREFRRLGGRGVPLLQVGDKVIHGFERQKIASQLRAAGARFGSPGR